MSLNRVILTGRLTKDPEYKELRDNMSVAKMSLAVDVFTKQQKETLFVDFSAWNQLALRCSTVLHKGSAVLVEGKLKQEKWVDKETGKERSKLTVVADQVLFLDKKEQETEGAVDQVKTIAAQKLPDAFDIELPF